MAFGDFGIYNDVPIKYDRVLTNYIGNDKYVIVPNDVLAIGERVFSGNDTVKRITLPKSLKRIQAHAFENCFALKQIDMPETLEYLGEAAFCNCCSLESIVIPDGITEIRFRTFKGCSKIKSVTLPDSFESGLRIEDVYDTEITVRAHEDVIEIIKRNCTVEYNVKVKYEVIEYN